MSLNSFSLSIVKCEFMIVEEGELNFLSPTLLGNNLPKIKNPIIVVTASIYRSQRLVLSGVEETKSKF